LNFIDYSGFFNNNELVALISCRDKNYANKNNRDDFIASFKFDAEKVIFPQQTHSSNVKVIGESKNYRKTDGLISITKNYGIGILIADCTPVFLFGAKSSHCGVIHSGWRGAANCITTNALEKFIGLGNKPIDIKAVLGPSIQRCCFEIGKDVSQFFSSKNLFSKNKSKFYLDLKSVIYEELISAGLSVKNIYKDSHCTFCNDEKFFSYRREGLSAGRMVAIMKLVNK